MIHVGRTQTDGRCYWRWYWQPRYSSCCRPDRLRRSAAPPVGPDKLADFEAGLPSNWFTFFGGSVGDDDRRRR